MFPLVRGVYRWAQPGGLLIASPMATELESLGGCPLIYLAVVPDQGSETGHCQRQGVGTASHTSWILKVD